MNRYFKKMTIILLTTILATGAITLTGCDGFPGLSGNAAKNLKGKRIIFLGSSVTYGAKSGGESFADFLASQYGCESIKEAVSGTTLVDENEKSYVSRLKKLNVEGKVDLFVCQLSTNDASKKKPLGSVSESTNIEDFDTKTVAGAIEFIIAYAKETYGCPVMFYTGPKYDNGLYGEMVELLRDIAEKWDMSVIDLWNEPSFSDLSDEKRARYMADSIHPTWDGYKELWTPFFAKKMGKVLAKSK